MLLGGKGTFTAGGMQLLILRLALPFALSDLLGQEIALLRRELRKTRTTGLMDPSKDMVQALNRFLNWFVLVARQIMIPVADVPELQRKDSKMKEALQCVYPKKSGEKFFTPWNISKEQVPDHT